MSLLLRRRMAMLAAAVGGSVLPPRNAADWTGGGFWRMNDASNLCTGTVAGSLGAAFYAYTTHGYTTIAGRACSGSGATAAAVARVTRNSNTSGVVATVVSYGGWVYGATGHPLPYIRPAGNSTSPTDYLAAIGYDTSTTDGPVQITVRHLSSTVITQASTGVSSTKGAWQHWVCVHDLANRRTKAYINGALVYDQTYAGGSGASITNPTAIFLTGETPSPGTAGYISDMFLLCREITQSEVSALVNGEVPA